MNGEREPLSDPQPPMERCARCGEWADGLARIDGERYCHAPSAGRDCYEMEEHDRSLRTSLRRRFPGLADVLRPLEGASRSRGDIEEHHGFVDDAAYELLSILVTGHWPDDADVQRVASLILAERETVSGWWYA